MTQDRKQKNAHAKVAKAVKNGDLIRPHECSLCGLTDSCGHVEIVAHHWKGYDYPLDVWWICKSCNWQLRGSLFHKGVLDMPTAQALIPAHTPYFGVCYTCYLQQEYKQFAPYVEDLKDCIQKMFADQDKYSDLINFVDAILPPHISFSDFSSCNEAAMYEMVKWECDCNIREEFGLPERRDIPWLDEEGNEE